MSTITPIPMSEPQTTGVPPITPAPKRRMEHLTARVMNKGKLYISLFLLMLPVLGGMALFTYYPQYAAVKYSFYKWDGQQTVDYIGWNNYRDAFTKDTIFWPSFRLTLILLVANAVKMWPSIFVAVVMHRIKSERWQYLYRVLFVIPMIIPGLVMLLIWKSFFDANNGVLNTTLNATGLRQGLGWLDVKLPELATWTNAQTQWLGYVPGGIWGLLVMGAMILSGKRGLEGIKKGYVWWGMMAAVAYGVAHFAVDEKYQYAAWLGWMGLGVLTAVIATVVGKRNAENIRWVGWGVLGVSAVILLATSFWPDHTRAFETDAPNWLGKAELIIPSLILWGFPWVGTVGVLLYLAGLQTIPLDVYEAAELDGVGSIGRLFRIELPLIMTQVRINLIFMTIGTLTDFGLILLLLGAYGGPGSKGMVPGLYAYNQAFVEQKFGYACALGMVMFVIIMGITVMYQKYVKVDK